MRTYSPGETVDAVVIGTGAGGAPLLARLAGAGLSVVALEAGRAWSSTEHTPDETEAQAIYWLDERLSGGSSPIAFGANNSGRGVGGSTLHWGAFCPRPDSRDLRLRTLTGEGEDWPITYDELLPYLVEVETFLGVSGPANYPWDPSRRYPLPPVRRNAPADLMARGCEMLGIRATDAPAALVSTEWQQEGFGLRRACVNCGACHQGCRNASKASTDTTFLPLAVANGAEIRAESTAFDVERDSDGRITAVAYRQGGIDLKQRCRALFLCAGGVETPRLLLNLDLANSSGAVGRHFTAHVATQVWGRFDAEIRMNRGYPSSLITEDFVRPDGASFAGGYLVQSLGVQPIALATNLVRGANLWGARLVELLDDYLHLAGIGINGECLPREDNRLTLADECDALGLRKARVDFALGPNERSLDAHARATMTAIWEAAGARDIVAVDRTAHTIGTCRMGPDGDRAVVDGAGRSFDIANLYISDNSVFPSSLAANPALTTMALSLRTADLFLRCSQT